MTDRLAIAIAQLNPTVGDIDGNAELIRRARAEAAALGADLLLGSELLLSGYPPEDLVLKPDLLARIEAAVAALAAETGDGGPGQAGSPQRDVVPSASPPRNRIRRSSLASTKSVRLPGLPPSSLPYSPTRIACPPGRATRSSGFWKPQIGRAGPTASQLSTGSLTSTGSVTASGVAQPIASASSAGC